MTELSPTATSVPGTAPVREQLVIVDVCRERLRVGLGGGREIAVLEVPVAVGSVVDDSVGMRMLVLGHSLAADSVHASITAIRRRAAVSARSAACSAARARRCLDRWIGRTMLSRPRKTVNPLGQIHGLIPSNLS